ncbi:MAG: 2-C-methyl-D-erythritol 2,4-cyclodiphosphate synthase [Acidobacteriota bacterium]
MMDIRVGQGWDTHRLAWGAHLILGGIHIPSDRGQLGHSDADVLSHAITDALLGALALGDIGMLFPDTDQQWKGANSAVFLAEAVRRVREYGFNIVNVDSTVILEKPKLKDYRLQIRESLAKTLGVTVDRVSVKFKTAEGVGPVGELRSSEAQAVVTLSR